MRDKDLLLLLLLALVGLALWQKHNKGVWPWETKPMLTGGNNPSKVALIEAPKPSRVLAFTMTITDTPQRLPEGKPVFGELRVSTPAANSGDIYFADSPVGTEGTIRFTIAAGKEQVIKISDLTMLYAHGTTGDKVSIFAEIDG